MIGEAMSVVRELLRELGRLSEHVASLGVSIERLILELREARRP